MKRNRPIIVALILASLLIISAVLFKGRGAGDWVDAGIYIAGVYFFFLYYGPASRGCSPKEKK